MTNKELFKTICQMNEGFGLKSKAEEATNDFCTRCFKYNRCTKVQSECTMADSYQEGYEDGYRQAEKDTLDKLKEIHDKDRQCKRE